jgi:hypothetical protein
VRLKKTGMPITPFESADSFYSERSASIGGM